MRGIEPWNEEDTRNISMQIAWELGEDVLPPPASAPAVTSGAAPAVTSGAAHASADAISDVSSDTSDTSSDTSDTSSDVAPEASTNVVDVSMPAVLGREIAMLAGNRDIPTAITDAITNNPAIANTLNNFIANAIANPANTEISEALRLQFVAVAEARDMCNELLGRGPPTVAPWNHTPKTP